MVRVFSPSSIPVKVAWSLFLSKTCTLSTASLLKFFVTTAGSSLKNSSPSTNTFSTLTPCATISPLVFTLIPGKRFNKSCTLALGPVLKLSALNSKVSPFILIAATLPCTITSCSKLILDIKGMVLRSIG